MPACAVAHQPPLGKAEPFSALPPLSLLTKGRPAIRESAGWQLEAAFFFFFFDRVYGLLNPLAFRQGEGYMCPLGLRGRSYPDPHSPVGHIKNPSLFLI